MSFSKGAWNQLKGITAQQLIKALQKDGWVREETIGATQGFRHPDGHRVVIHVHPKKTHGPGLLKALLADIGWSEKEMQKLKLIK